MIYLAGRLTLCVTIVILPITLVGEICAQELTEGQVLEEIFELAWSDHPQSFDVSVFVKSSEQQLSAEAIREKVELAFLASDANAEKISDLSRAEAINGEVDRILLDQSKPAVLKQRIRRDRFKYRLDQELLRGSGVFGVDSTSQTFVNRGDPALGDYTHFDYDHTAQVATILDDRSKWRELPVQDWIGFPQSAAMLLKSLSTKVNISNDGEHKSLPDVERLRRIVSGSDKYASLQWQIKSQDDIDISPGESLAEINLLLGDGSAPPSTSVANFLVSAADFEKIYRFERLHPTSGNLIEKYEYSRYDDANFAQEIVVSKYSDQNVLVASKEIAVKSVDVNVDIDPSTFEFNAPLDYMIVDRRPESPLAISSSLRKKPEPALLDSDSGDGSIQNSLPDVGFRKNDGEAESLGKQSIGSGSSVSKAPGRVSTQGFFGEGRWFRVMILLLFIAFLLLFVLFKKRKVK